MTVRTPQMRECFLTALAETAQVKAACEKCRVSMQTVYNWRKDEPEFALEWDEARVQGMDRLEDEAVRRAHDGVDKPVFWQGVQVATVKEYSDTLLMFLLRGGKPERYRDRVSTEVTGKDGGPLAVNVDGARERLASRIASLASVNNPSNSSNEPDGSGSSGA